ncbi:MAG TPA: hypothetical protein VLM91_08755 [Candidatus Methylomirabilis sp.]|nr:hypothetical protein [Candidatus Methylomirabilis sp.]
MNTRGFSFPHYLAPLCLGVTLLAGCASLAVTRCDTVEDRDGKYFGRFFLGVATIGLSEVTIQQEEVRQAYEGSPSCPPPSGVRVVSAQKPSSAGGQSAAVGTLVNGTRWTVGVYLNQDPGAPGIAPFTILRPNGSLQVAFRPGEYRLVARPTGGPPGTLPAVSWSRQMDIDPRVRGFKLQFNEADFK